MLRFKKKEFPPPPPLYSMGWEIIKHYAIREQRGAGGISWHIINFLEKKYYSMFSH